MVAILSTALPILAALFVHPASLAAQTPWELEGLSTCAASLAPWPQYPSSSPDTSAGMAAFRYLGSYPANCMTGWGVDLQGMTHDSLYWYFTQKGALWRFPMQHDLGRFITVPDQMPGVRRAEIPTALRQAGYDHFGAPAYRRGLILIPLEGGRRPAVGIFRAVDLSYRGSLALPASTGPDGWRFGQPTTSSTARTARSTATMGCWRTRSTGPGSPALPSRLLPIPSMPVSCSAPAAPCSC